MYQLRTRLYAPHKCKTIPLLTNRNLINIPMNSKWDPTKAASAKAPSPKCVHRIKTDIENFYKTSPLGIYIAPDEEDVTLVHALIEGAVKTPYEKGFFYFLLRFPLDYPMHPPKAKLLTTGKGSVRFNPNLYKDGKICLSILGTWDGPSWTPIQTLCSVLLSIQSIMNERPYFNEPGFGRERASGDSLAYNEAITHETIKVAVCGMLEGSSDTKGMPQILQESMQKSFLNNYDFYVTKCKQKQKQLGKKLMRDPYFGNTGHFDYGSLLKRLQAIKKKLNVKTKGATNK